MKTICFVDDNEQFLEDVAEIAADYGVYDTVHTFNSPMDFRAAYLAGNLSEVSSFVFDLDMGAELNGIDLIELIKTNVSAGDITVVSGGMGEEVRRVLEKAGVRYFLKPLSVANLQRVLSE